MASRMQFAGRYKVVDTQTLRVKLARRKSLTQKENRHHEFGKSRDLRLMDPNTSVLKGLQAMEELSETSLTQCHENSAVLRETGSKARGERSQQRQEMLWRYKEEKLLRKLKEQREKAQKSVFRCGIYRPDADLPTLPSVRNVAKTKDKQPAPTTRVTRSAARAEAPPSKTTRRQPVGAGNSYIRASEPTTRGHRQGQATKMAEKENHGFPPARTTRATAPRVLTKNTNVAVKPQKKTSKDPKSQEIPPETKAGSRILVEEHKAGEVSNKSASDPPEPPRERIVSFAPENFTFKPLDGLCSYRLQPMTPGTADKFLSFTWSPVRAPSGNAAEAPEDAIEVCEAEVRLPSFHGVTSPACPPPTETTQECNVLPQHDVPYFRGALRSEIQRLTSLCAQWDERFGMAIPDDAKDLIRTTVGQTRLLMGERFKQFEGLVDNCEFKRGEKETTCTDLDGFWDMVYFQIEDVVKKFANLGKLEENSWQQNTVQPEKAVKKRSASVAKPNPGDQARVAARSRLAAIKAAMKKGRVPEEVAGAAAAEPVVFDAGFFRVESPAKQPSGVKAKRSSLQASTLCRSPMRTPPAAPSSGFADGGLWVTPGVNPPVGRTLFGDAEEDRLNESEPREKSPHLLGNESHLDLVKYLVPPEECNLSFGPPKSFNLVTGSQGETSIHAHILSDGEIEDEVFTCDSKRTEQQMDVITSLAEGAAHAPDV